MRTRTAAWVVLMLGCSLAVGWRAHGAETWTLDRAIAFALTNSPDAQVAAHRMAAARAGVDQANAAFWPRVQFQSSYTRTDNPMLAFGAILNQRSFSSSLDFNRVPEVDDLNVRGVATVPVYAGGQIKAGQRGARAKAEAAEWETKAVRNSLAFEVAYTFHTLHKTREFVRACEAAVTAYESNLAVAQKRHQAGSLLKADLLDVEVRAAQAREDLVRARNARSLTEKAFWNLLGITGTNLVLAEEAPAVAVPASEGIDGRPELAALRLRQRAAEAATRGARGGYLPRVSLFGSLDYDYGWEMDGDGKSWAAGAMVQWDLWDGRLTRARVAEAQAQWDELLEQERKLRLAIDFEVEQARLNLQDADQRLAVTEKAVAQAGESVELTRARFEQGLALSSQLIDAETAQTAARVRRAEATTDRAIAIAALRRALGVPQIDPDSTPH